MIGALHHLAIRGAARQLVALLIGLLAWLSSPALARAQEPARDIQTLWSDGDALLLAGDRRALRIYGRDGQEQASEAVNVEQFVAADGTRAVGGVSAVFAAADGRLVRWRPGAAVEEDRVPLLEGDELVAVLVDASGTIYAIGSELALYERGHNRWRVYSYPTHMRPLAAAASPGGQIYIVGRDGLLVRFLDGEWDRPLIPGLSPESIRAPWYDAWYSAVTKTLWVRAGRDRLLELEFGEQREVTSEEQPPSEPDDAAEDEQAGGAALRVSGTVPTREHPIPLGAPSEDESPATFTAITGVSSAAGDRVVMSAGDRVWLWERERFVLIGNDARMVHDLALDEADDAVWVAAHGKLERLPLEALDEESQHRVLRDEEKKMLERLRRRDAWRLRNADAPRFFWMPTLRIDNGVVFPLGADPVAGYSLEIGAGAMMAPLTRERGPTLWVWPELAYRYETHPTRGGHLFDLGVGVGFGTHLIAAFYRPRLVFGGVDQGTRDGPAVYGLRHGIALEAVAGVLGLEVSQQYLGSNQGPLHDIRIGLSVNLAPLIWLGILWTTVPTGE
ncbi:MAG TPA: hypothetical protein VM869_22415 [Enhygromyxa sp.]|nr:hypothetical protein [Enhygromyxa sp.]